MSWTEFWNILILISLSCTGFHAAMWEGNIGDKLIGKWAVSLPWFIRNPLFECLTCMASFWSLVLGPSLCFIFRIPFRWDLSFYWPILIVAVAGLNTLIMIHIYGRRDQL